VHAQLRAIGEGLRALRDDRALERVGDEDDGEP
jgi:hypothetical protein